MRHPDFPVLEDPVRIIGHVHCATPDDEIPKRRRTLVSDIVILPRYRDALLGLDAYSHLIVLFWMHRVPDTESLVTHPRGDPSLPRTGVLAARGRARPNPLGLAVVELQAFDGATLTVARLDAYDGTPVIDIKPYDHYDVVPDPRVPTWFRERLSR